MSNGGSRDEGEAGARSLRCVRGEPFDVCTVCHCEAAVCEVECLSKYARPDELLPARRRPRRSARASRLAAEDSDWDSEMDDDELDEEEGGGRRGGGRGGGASGKEKKKVGRPIAYKGDPDAPGLNEEDRRRIKRCASSFCSPQGWLTLILSKAETKWGCCISYRAMQYATGLFAMQAHRQP